MKNWKIVFDTDVEPEEIWADNFEKEWHPESMVWYWKFSDGSMIPCANVRAIICIDEPEESE